MNYLTNLNTYNLLSELFKCPYNINKIESLDIETLLINNKFIPFSVAITKKNKTLYKQIKSINNVNSDEILNFILEKCSNNKTYYVHNLTFETFVFLEKIIKNNIKFKWLCIKKNIYSLNIQHGKKNISFRCSYKLTLIPLEDAGEKLINIKKLPFPYKILNQNLKKIMKIKKEHFNDIESWNKFKNNNNLIINTHDYIKKYCINDAIITKNLVIKYWETMINIGITMSNKFLTAGAISVNYMYKICKNIYKYIPKDIENTIRPYYFGGRTEVFGNLKNNEIALHYDWSGMYAQCMCEKIPTGATYTTQHNLDINNPGFHYIKFTQNMKIPILPIKEDKLYFKNGIYEGLYWFEEILLFKDYGGKILKIKYSILVQNYQNDLKKFVLINNELRKKGGIYKQIGKNNNNTLYGRLGMNTETEIQELTNNKTKYIKEEEICNTLMGSRIKHTKSPSNIVIAAAITSKARIKLYKGFKEIEKNKGRILYCDTDSIIAAFDKSIYKKLLNKQLGEVFFDKNDENTIIKDAVFCIPKTYGIITQKNKEIVKIKGIMRNSIKFNKLKHHFKNNINIKTDHIEKFIKKNWNICIQEQTSTINLQNLNKRIWIDKEKTETKALNKIIS